MRPLRWALGQWDWCPDTASLAKAVPLELSVTAKLVYKANARQFSAVPSAMPGFAQVFREAAWPTLSC